MHADVQLRQMHTHWLRLPVSPPTSPRNNKLREHTTNYDSDDAPPPSPPRWTMDRLMVDLDDGWMDDSGRCSQSGATYNHTQRWRRLPVSRMLPR